MKKNTFLLVAAALAGLLQACSDNGSTSAQTGTDRMAGTNTGPSATPQADMAFANEAAMGGMAEVALGKMAADKGMDPKVKDFGEMMVKDHGKANDELKSIARSKNIQLPVDLDAEHQAIRDSLGRLSGKSFDTAYVNIMLDDHKKDLDLMRSEAADGMDAQLKAFAATTAPVIQSHLTKVQQIHDGMQ